jgi:hypothetical protein
MKLVLLCFAALAVQGCAKPDFRLQWPATIVAFPGIEGVSLAQVTSDVETLNQKLGIKVLSILKGSGSPVTIAKVTSFETPKSRNASVAQTDFAFVADDRLSVRFKETTRIAGRATLSHDTCLIELGSFLFDDGQKELLTAVLLHEIAHCAGLPHVAEKNELMSEVTFPFTTYTESHVDRFVDAMTRSIGIL